MIEARINVRTQRHQMRFQRILDAGSKASGMSLSGHDRDRTPGSGWATAIGAGTALRSGPQAREMQKKGRVANAERAALSTPSANRKRGGAPTPLQTAARQDARRTRMSEQGLPVTPRRPNITSGADKEKDQCANTGLLRKESWIVTFGIRSDRFIHA